MVFVHGKILGDHAQFPTIFDVSCRGEGSTLKTHGARPSRQQTGNARNRRCLAGAIRADEPKVLALNDGKGRFLNRRTVSIRVPKGTDFEKKVARRHGAWSWRWTAQAVLTRDTLPVGVQWKLHRVTLRVYPGFRFDSTVIVD
jgi:hypothetical protein